MVYTIRFSDAASEHVDALKARDRALLIDKIEQQLSLQPTQKTRNRKPMDPDKRMLIAPWELRVGQLRVYYAVEDTPEPVVVIVAVGIKARERLRIGGEDIEQ